MSLKRNISYSLIAQLLSAVLTFFTSIFITRILGAEGRGEYTIFTNASTFAVLLFGFSIHSTLGYFLNTERMKQDELLSSAFAIILLSTLLVSISLAVLNLLGLNKLAFPTHANVLSYSLLFVLNFFANLTNSVMIALFAAYKLFKQSSILVVLFLFFPLVTYAFLYYSNMTFGHYHALDIVLLIMVANTLISMLVYFTTLHSNIKIQLGYSRLKAKGIRQLIVFTGIAYMANVAQFLTYKMDFWLMDSYRGKLELGIYSLASLLAQMLWILPGSLGNVLYSQISSEPAKEPIQLKYIRFAPLIMYFTLVCAIAGGILSSFLLPILFGQEFKASFFPLLAFLCGSILFAHSTAITSMNAGRGRFKMNYIGSVIGFGLSLLLYPITISRFGMMGGAWASSVIYTFQVVYYTISFCKSENVALRDLFIVPTGEINQLIKPWLTRIKTIGKG